MTNVIFQKIFETRNSKNIGYFEFRVSFLIKMRAQIQKISKLIFTKAFGVSLVYFPNLFPYPAAIIITFIISL